MIRVMMRALTRLMRSRDGMATIEYGLIAAASVVILAILLPCLSLNLSNLLAR